MPSFYILQSIGPAPYDIRTFSLVLLKQPEPRKPLCAERGLGWLVLIIYFAPTDSAMFLASFPKAKKTVFGLYFTNHWRAPFIKHSHPYPYSFSILALVANLVRPSCPLCIPGEPSSAVRQVLSSSTPCR